MNSYVVTVRIKLDAPSMAEAKRVVQEEFGPDVQVVGVAEAALSRFRRRTNGEGISFRDVRPSSSH